MAAALALVVIGGLALVNALTSPPPGPAPSSALPSTQSVEEPGGSQEPPSVDPSAAPLVITVTGRPTTVFVKVPGSDGAVLLRGELGPGETRKYDQAPLDVVVSDSASVEVRIYGELQTDTDGGRGQWAVPARSG